MKRVVVLVGFLVFSIVAAVMPPEQRIEAQANCFQETGFCITNQQFAEYFQLRGGIRILGYPVSRSFTLEGFEVQFFQRVVLQLQGGQVARLNILDPGVMPMTRANQSVFPAPDPALAAAAPQPGSSDYASRAIEFIRSVSPNTWNGQPVGFFDLFNTTVPVEIAFAGQSPNPGLITLLNLEIWGLPTSRPAFDPGNPGFIYQRFQRGIMHYRAEVPVTEGILVGDYFKSVITARNLPSDLSADMQGSRFYAQYSPQSPNWLARPAQLANTNLTGAFEPGTGPVTPPAGPTPTPVSATATPGATATPTVTPTVGPTGSVELQLSDELINPGEQISVTVIGTSQRPITWIEWRADNSDDPILDSEYRFDCDDQLQCANVWTVIPTKAGRHTLRARLRDDTGARTEWVERELRVRDVATVTPTGTATATPGPGTPTATPVVTAPNVRIQLSSDRVDRNEAVTVTVIATADRGLDWIEWRGDNTGDAVLDENHRFDCDNRTDCANVWTVTPTKAGTFDILARTRVQGGDRTEWVRTELRVR